MAINPLGKPAGLGHWRSRLTGSRHARLAFYAGVAVLATTGLVRSVDMAVLRGQGALHYDVYSVAELRVAATALAASTSGGVIRLEPGEYDLGTTPLAFNGAENLSLIGSGRGTRIVYRGTGAALDFTSVKRATVADLMVAGAATGEHGIRFTLGSNNTIRDAWFDGFTKNGVRLEAETTATLRDSTFTVNGEAQLYTNGGVYTDILNNRFQGNSTTRGAGSIGVELNNSQNVNFSGNRASHFDVALKIVNGAAWNRYENNELFKNHMENVVLEGPAGGAAYHQTFTGNLFYDASRLGTDLYSNVRIKNTRYVTFTSNSFFPRDHTIVAKNNLWLEGNNGNVIFRDNILRFSSGAGHVLNGIGNTNLLGFDAVSSNFAETPSQLVY